MKLYQKSNLNSMSHSMFYWKRKSYQLSDLKFYWLSDLWRTFNQMFDFYLRYHCLSNSLQYLDLWSNFKMLNLKFYWMKQSYYLFDLRLYWLFNLKLKSHQKCYQLQLCHLLSDLQSHYLFCQQRMFHQLFDLQKKSYFEQKCQLNQFGRRRLYCYRQRSSYYLMSQTHRLIGPKC